MAKSKINQNNKFNNRYIFKLLISWVGLVIWVEGG